VNTGQRLAGLGRRRSIITRAGAFWAPLSAVRLA